MSARVRRVDLDDASWVELHERCWSEAEARATLVALMREHEFETRSIMLFGRRVLQPREIAWAGDESYAYSGDRLEVRPWSSTLQRVRERVSRLAGCDFNHALLNHYRDGSDSMGAHSDDEAELGPAPVIASLSLGATRRFLLRPKRGRDGQKLDLDLSDGDLLVMGGSLQERFKHALPKSSRVGGARLNVTFRRVVPR